MADNQLAVTDVLLGDSTCGAPDFTAEYAQAGGWVLPLLSRDLHPARSTKLRLAPNELAHPSRYAIAVKRSS